MSARLSVGVTMQFGKYRLIEKIGQGGMAEVFYAHIVGSQGFTKEVALKRVLPHLCEDPDFVESFVDEARLGGLLNHHHIVQTLDFGAEKGIYYIAMEYVHGLTLRELMSYHKRRNLEIPPPIVLDLALQLCDGLRYAHHAEDEKGNPIHMVHRDLKPTNILLSSHGVIKIADFGIARAETNSRRTALGGVLKGTAQYMSPEQAFGELHLDHRSDIFSWGSIVYELITLTPLFYDRKSSVQTLRNVQDAVVDEPLARMVETQPYSRALYPVLRHVLARDPAARPSDISEIIPPLRQVQLSLGMVDVQSWVEAIMNELGRSVRGRRPGSMLNVPVQPAGRTLGEGQPMPVGEPPVPGRDRVADQSAPTVAEPLSLELDSESDEATPVVRLKDIPGQPRLRDAPKPPEAETSQDISVTLPAPRKPLHEAPAEGEPQGLDTPTLRGVIEHPVETPIADAPARGTSTLTPTVKGPGSRLGDIDAVPFAAGALNEEALAELPPPDVEPIPEPAAEAGDGYGDAVFVAGGGEGSARPESDWPPASQPSDASPGDKEGEFLDKTPAWVEGTAGSSTTRLEDEEGGQGAVEARAREAGRPTQPRAPGATRRLLFAAAGGVLALVVLVVLATVVLPLRNTTGSADGLRVTIDTVPGGAEVVFTDKRLEPGRSPLARQLPEPTDCIDVTIRHDGYETVQRCLPVGKDGFVEPVQLEPDPRAVGVILRYPLDVEGVRIHVDDWEMDLRQRMSRSGDQASIRTYVSPRPHRVRVTTSSCGELEGEFDFQHTSIYKFIKIVRSSKAPCAIAFSQDD